MVDDPFEIDGQAAHLFKHPHLGLADLVDVWRRPEQLPTDRCQLGSAGPPDLTD